MMISIQYDFFEEIKEDETLQRVEALELSHDKVRKRLFAEVAGLSKEFLKMTDEMDRLRGMIMERKK